MEKVAIIGTGLIGRAWAMVFARAGHTVKLYDSAPGATDKAIGLIDEKKREMVMPGHDNVEVPIIDKKTAQVLSVVGDKANVMDTETYETFDLAIPADMKDKVMEGVQVLYWIIMGEKVMKQIKSGAE